LAPALVQELPKHAATARNEYLRGEAFQLLAATLKVWGGTGWLGAPCCLAVTICAVRQQGSVSVL
jgi:hypothetical protein